MDARPYTPGNDDVAIEMLREIFGNAVGVVLGSSPASAQSTATANMLGTAFGFFNSGVLFFGAIILTWVTVFGVANTANDGQVLGKKWSTFYTPLRTFTASAFLIPSASGYSAVQLAILLIVSWSVGFASNMWGMVVDYVVNTSTTDQVMRSVIDDRNFDQLALNALRMQVCSFAVNQGVNATMGTGSANLQLTQQESSVKRQYTSTYKTTLSYRDAKWPGSEDICGRIILTTTFTAPDKNSAATSVVSSTLRNALETVHDGEMNDLKGAITNLRYKYASGLFGPSGMAPFAQEIIRVANTSGEKISSVAVFTGISKIREAMLSDIRSEIQKQISSDNAGVSSKLKQCGWVCAGSLQRELARIKDAIQTAMATKMEVVKGTYSANQLSGDVGIAVNGVLAQYDGLVAALIAKGDQELPIRNETQPTLPTFQTSFSYADFADHGTSIQSKIQSYWNEIPDMIMNATTHYLGSDSTDPVMQIKDLGDYMVGIAQAVMVTKAFVVGGLSAVQKTAEAESNQPVAGIPAGFIAGAVAGVLALFVELYEIAKPGFMVLLYGGYFLGMWIPMVPFYVFALGVIGWIVQVGEALAAGALWMMMHLTPERDDSFIGSQQQGYLLIMSLFCRPALMVLGLVFSMAASVPSVNFVNSGYMLSFRVIQSDSITGILSIAGFLLIYGVILFGVLMLLFSLPQTLPDRILRWVGAGIGDLGEQNSMSRIEGGASNQARTAAVAMSAKQAALDNTRKDRTARRAQNATAEADNAAGAMPEGHTQPMITGSIDNTGTDRSRGA